MTDPLETSVLRNAAFNSQGDIDAELEHPELGWIPITLSADDQETADLHAQALTLDPAAYVTPPLPPVSPADVRREAARRLEELASDYAPAERETWPVQVAEARALAADPQAPTPMLTALAAGRTVSVPGLAALVLNKADALAVASGAILAAQAALLTQDPIPTDYADDGHWPAPAQPQTT